MLGAIAFPTIDPVLVEIGPLAIRWYSLAYIAGILLGWRYARFLAERFSCAPTAKDIDDFVIWVTLGIIIGGRLGYVAFYKPEFFFGHPLEILQVWQGGMSFHGGMIGVAVAAVRFAKRRRIPLLTLSDITACATPMGLFFGRLANFVNGELYGRVSDVPWAMVFPGGGPEPRHPSQIYQAALEGIVLFAVLFMVSRASTEGRGLLTGVFLSGYGLFRIVGELFRQPDAHIGFLFGGMTFGQMLSVPMIAVGVWLVMRRKPSPAAR